MNWTAGDNRTGTEASSPHRGATVDTAGLSVQYGRSLALKDVTVQCPGHEITAVVGPSGCGKTTFLSCLNRLTDLVANCRVSGRAHVEGLDVLDPACDVVALRRRVGMVFQKPNPFPLSVRRNLALPLKEHGVTGSSAEDVIESTLRDVGLWDEVKDRLDTPAQNLSGGQQQRLCLARALALKPEVILFDEPCSALDPIAGDTVERLIVSLRRRVTILVATHNLAQARRIADHLAVFWIRNGCGTVIESGPAQQLFESAADPDAAAYLDGARG